MVSEDTRDRRFYRGVVTLLVLGGLWLEFLFTIVVFVLLVKGLT